MSPRPLELSESYLQTPDVSVARLPPTQDPWLLPALHTSHCKTRTTFSGSIFGLREADSFSTKTQSWLEAGLGLKAQSLLTASPAYAQDQASVVKQHASAPRLFHLPLKETFPC